MDRAVQNDAHRAQLKQLDLATRHRVFLELRKEERAVLPKLFEARKTMTSLLPRSKCCFHPANRLLKHLRLHVLQVKKYLLSRSQRILLLVVVRRSLIVRLRLTCLSSRR